MTFSTPLYLKEVRNKQRHHRVFKDRQAERERAGAPSEFLHIALSLTLKRVDDEVHPFDCGSLAKMMAFCCVGHHVHVEAGSFFRMALSMKHFPFTRTDASTYVKHGFSEEESCPLLFFFEV